MGAWAKKNGPSNRLKIPFWANICLKSIYFFSYICLKCQKNSVQSSEGHPTLSHALLLSCPGGALLFNGVGSVLGPRLVEPGKDSLKIGRFRPPPPSTLSAGGSLHHPPQQPTPPPPGGRGSKTPSIPGLVHNIFPPGGEPGSLKGAGWENQCWAHPPS